MKMIKKSMAFLLAALMLVSVFTVCAGAVPCECPYTAVRGTLPNCDWDGTYDELNKMTLDENSGLYTITYDKVPKGDYQFQVMSYDGWYSMDDLLYVPVTVSEESDLTITFDQSYFDGYFFGKIDFYGEHVSMTEDSEFQSAGVLGNFNPKCDWSTFNSVLMNETAKRYYTLTFDNILAGDYEYIFVCNQSYFKSWYAEEGKESELSGNCVFCDQYSDNDNKFKLHVGENDKYVTFTLDLRNFDFDTQKGAVYSVSLSESEPSEPTVPELPTEATEETTAVDTTVYESEPVTDTEQPTTTEAVTTEAAESEAEKIKSLKQSIMYALADASMTIIEGVKCRGEEYLNYEAFEAAYKAASQLLEKADATVSQFEEAYKNLTETRKNLVRIEAVTVAVETTSASEPTTVTEPQQTVPETTCPEKKTVVNKKANPIKVSVKTKTVKLKKLKKKAQTVKALTIKNAKGKVNCKIVKADKIKKYLKINSKGVITFKKWKKAKKGIYKITVQIKAKGNSEYKSKTVSKVVKVNIK